MKIGNRLRAIRKQHKLTQQNIADILGIDRTTYTFYETGATSPSITTLYRISQIYNVTVGYLMGVEDNRPELCRQTPIDEKVAQFDSMSELSKDERVLVAFYRTVNIEDKPQLIETLKKYTSLQDKD